MFSRTSVPINDNFVGKKWNNIIVAPITGKESELADATVNYKLAPVSNVEIVPYEIIKSMIVKRGLEEQLELDSVGIYSQLSSEFSADGFIIGIVDTRRAVALLGTRAQVATVVLNIYHTTDHRLASSVRKTASSCFLDKESLIVEASEDASDNVIAVSNQIVGGQ